MEQAGFQNFKIQLEKNQQKKTHTQMNLLNKYTSYVEMYSHWYLNIITTTVYDYLVDKTTRKKNLLQVFIY